MTAEEIDVFPAGPKMDAAVHHVLYPDHKMCRRAGFYWFVNPNAAGAVHAHVRPFSTDIYFALDVVEKVGLWVGRSPTADCWEAVFDHGHAVATADTAPLAICRAALKVTKGHETSRNVTKRHSVS